jgi:hypothetical protein
MSLLNLLHQSVVLKFADAAKPEYEPGTGYVFRLVGVDAMGFLQLQDLRLSEDEEHETISEPYWINKDLVLAIHDYASTIGKDSLKFSGGAAAPAPKKAVVNHESPAPAKAKRVKAKAVAA